jgi:hypothetical protein
MTERPKITTPKIGAPQRAHGWPDSGASIPQSR